MNAQAVSYPSLQRRLIAKRRSRALFLPRTAQQVSRAAIIREIARAVAALAAIAAWGVLIFLLAP